MTEPFKPIGEQARWVPIYDELRKLEVGDQITYGQLLTWTGYDIREDRKPFYRAKTELLTVDKRAMVNILSVGYKIVSAADHVKVADTHNRRARGQTTRAKRTLVNTDFNELTQEQAQHSLAQEIRLSTVEGLLREVSAHQRRQDRTIEHLREGNRQIKAEAARLSDETSEKFAQYDDALAQHAELLKKIQEKVVVPEPSA